MFVKTKWGKSQVCGAHLRPSTQEVEIRSLTSRATWSTEWVTGQPEKKPCLRKQKGKKQKQSPNPKQAKTLGGDGVDNEKTVKAKAMVKFSVRSGLLYSSFHPTPFHLSPSSTGSVWEVDIIKLSVGLMTILWPIILKISYVNVDVCLGMCMEVRGQL